jgi:cyclophilin family peptidyl-prolyl cis-trans isomerase
MRHTILIAVLLSACSEPNPRPDWDIAPRAAPAESTPPPATPDTAAVPDREPPPSRAPGTRVSLHPGGVPAPLLAAVDAHLELHPVDRGTPDWRSAVPRPPDVLPFGRSRSVEWVLQTNRGTLRFRLTPETAPRHVISTVWLTRIGYYDGLVFHRVIPGFMAQGGCPRGDGTGGPGYAYSGEFPADAPRHDRRGMLSIANAGPDTDGSQFFVTFAPAAWLDGKHTVFGELVDGSEVLATLEALGRPDGKPKAETRILRAEIQVR